MARSLSQLLSTKKLGTFLYVIGSILILIIWAGMTWGDFEASLFASSLPADKKLNSFSCPVVISKNETATIRAKFVNHTDKPYNTNVRTFISLGFVTSIEQVDTPLRLQPGESQTLEWSATADQAVWNRLLMARIYSFRSYPTPAYAASCGILVVNILNIPGRYLLMFGLIFGISFLFSGMYLLFKDRSLKEGVATPASAITTNLVLMLSGLVIAFTGNWIFSLLILILDLFLFVIIWAVFIQKLP